jgi:hypothetical protein
VRGDGSRVKNSLFSEVHKWKSTECPAKALHRKSYYSVSVGLGNNLRLWSEFYGLLT